MKRIRVVLCGDPSVGKSSIIKRFATGTFNDMIGETIAGAFHSQFVRHNGETIALEIWDTAGSERYHSVIPSFFRSASAVVIVYDVTARASFEAADYWMDFARTHAPEAARLFLVGNKADLFSSRDVFFEEAKSWADARKFESCVDTSAKTGEAIDNLFAMLADVPGSGTVNADLEGKVIVLDKPKCC
jgi:small GTP-binding protein